MVTGGFSLWQLAKRTLGHFWRTNLALLLGVAVGTAVLTGALIVGDSVRGSLRALTIQRLGRIDEILLGEQFFGRELARSMRDAELPDEYTDVVPVVLINKATIEVIDRPVITRHQGVTLIGCEEEFWELDSTGATALKIGPDQIVINTTLAQELKVDVGERLLIRIGKSGGVATDSPMSRTDELVQTITDLEIARIIPAQGLGRFGLAATQQVPANAFVALETLQRGLQQSGKVNAVLFAGQSDAQAASESSFEALKQNLRPTLTDLGLGLKQVKIASQLGPQPTTVAQYQSLSNDRMMFSGESNDAVQQTLSQLQLPNGYLPVLTYLATKIQKLSPDGQPTGELIPYSTVAAVDSAPVQGPLLEGGQPVKLALDEIVLNSWAAEVLGAEVGDAIRLTYFEPEATYGNLVERHADFRLHGVVPITQPRRRYARGRAAQFDEPPTLANDPDLTPDVPGITDAESIAKWDAPFPVDYDLLDRRDDRYWDNYRTTPKAFIALEAGRNIWDSRFGATTSFRIPSDDDGGEALAQQLAEGLRSHTEAFGLRWIRAKADGLKASQGTTPFDALFFGFSMFIIASALMLVSLLLRLSLEQRGRQLGLLGSLGFDWKRSIRLLLAEHSVLVMAGGVVGVVFGIVYAWLMLAGLRTWWLAAVVTPFMQLRIAGLSLLVGLGLGIVASLLTIVLTMRRLRKVSAAELLSGSVDDISESRQRARWFTYGAYLPWALIAVAMVLGAIAPRLAPEPQGGAFFGGGFCVLAAILIWVSGWLHRMGNASSRGELTLHALALRNLARNPGRSTLTIGLVASACFLIVAISAFRLSPTDEGTGGFELVGASDQPIVVDLQDAIVREDLGLSGEAFADVHVVPLRLQEGDDASCRNLYQSARPQLLGVTPAFLELAPKIGEVEWAGFDADLMPSQTGEASNWRLLSDEVDVEPGVIPVVLDKNTAMYGLQLYGGVGQEFERDYGTAGRLRFKVVGLLAGSIFQGSLLVRESDLLARFPRLGGFRYFLVDAPVERADQVSAALENALGDQGLDLTDTKTLLAELLAVQNTYLSTFQSLGGLGLLLGTFGLAAVQLRNVMQRRGELALMRAAGFRNDQLTMLVLREHATLLLGGLLVGIIAAAIVVLPHLLFGGASLPLFSLLAILGLIALVGLASGVVPQRYLNKTPILAALRGD